MATQTEKGKAFEYACLKAIDEQLSKKQDVIIESSQALQTAQQFYDNTKKSDIDKMNSAAMAGIKRIIKLEPQLQHKDSNNPLRLTIQPDSKGAKGDVRDIICIKKNNKWEIGLSCKHNHFAVKHSRLSPHIDFGYKWFNKKCSQNYFNEITPLFNKLKNLKKENKLWRDLEKKDEHFYKPLLEAFSKELLHLEQIYPKEIPAALVSYLLGRNDFYKIIAINKNNTTEIQGFNMFGSLNKKAPNIKIQTKIPRIKLPNKFFDISFEENSTNTIIVSCDNGWALSFRIHNASSKIETSLKFDVKLESTPDSLYRLDEPWN